MCVNVHEVVVFVARLLACLPASLLLSLSLSFSISLSLSPSLSVSLSLSLSLSLPLSPSLSLSLCLVRVCVCVSSFQSRLSLRAAARACYAKLSFSDAENSSWIMNLGPKDMLGSAPTRTQS